jgi:hypothetical protein
MMNIRVIMVFAFLVIMIFLGILLLPSDILSSKAGSLSSSSTSSTLSPLPVRDSSTRSRGLAGVSPQVHQTSLEIVTDSAATGDGGNSWGGHQTRIVRTEDGVFTAYTVEGGGYFTREWRLAWRQDDGTWPVVAQGLAGREPVNLLASPDGTLYVIGWPNGVGTMWSGKPESGTLAMTATTIPNVATGYWPYNSAGIDEVGDLCVLSSTGGEEPGGAFDWACYLPAQAGWITQTNELDYRYCYTYVFPDPDRQLSLVSTRDVRWEALGYQKPSGASDYVFNAFRYWRTSNIISETIQELSYAEEAPTDQYPAPDLNAQTDAYLDTNDRMHIIYWRYGASTEGSWQLRHRAVSPDGDLLYDVEMPGEIGGWCRIFQDSQEQFYILGSSGRLYPVGQDGIDLGPPIVLDLEGYEVEYSGFGVSVPRTGTPLSDVIDVVFPSDNGTKWIYFQLDLSPQLIYLPLVLRY